MVIEIRRKEYKRLVEAAIRLSIVNEIVEGGKDSYVDKKELKRAINSKIKANEQEVKENV